MTEVDARKSGGGNEETLRRYWTEGAGAAKIRWGVPGDFNRCVAEVDKAAHGKVPDIKGYCANLHHRALGVWPGQEKGAAALALALPPVVPSLTVPSLVIAQIPWDESAHPRAPAGDPGGGQFAPGGGTAPPPAKQQPAKPKTAHELHLENTPTLKNGQNGAAVKRAQGLLNKAGIKPALKEDGSFGPKTEAAVKAFQKQHKLPVTGVVDRATWEAAAGAAKTPVKSKTTKAAGEVPALVTMPGVDLVAAGTWGLSSGENTFTKDDLASAIEAAECPAVGNPLIKLGHIDPRFDGQPAVGRVSNMTLTADGNKIAGDLTGMPGWLGEVLASAYPNRSIEGCYDFRCQIGHVHPFVITGLALLGVTPPGVGVLSDLDDIAALYGVQAAVSTGTTWSMRGDTMPDQVMAAVTTEDVRRAYYSQPNASMTNWITEIQLSPPQLIVCDEKTDQVYRVPVTITGSTIVFGDAVPVEIEYKDVAASRTTGAVVVFASAADSRAGMVTATWSASTQIANMGDSPTSAQINAMFALPGDTKSDSKLPHHDVSASGEVGSANPDGCSAAIGALNGAHGGVVSVSAADQRKAYDHLAAHLTAAGKTPPPFNASAPGTSASASPDHGPMTGSHSHNHPAYGSQGGDDTHMHSHAHSGDNNHGHDHTSASGPVQEGGSKVDFTDEQNKALRAALGIADDTELTADLVVTATGKLQQQATAKVSAASRTLPPGVIAVDKEAWDALNQRVQDGEEYRKRQMVKERDVVIAAAIKDGKFSVAQRGRWSNLWDENPEGTREVLAGLQKNVVPVKDIGAPGATDPDDVDEEYAALFGKNS